MSRYSFEVTKEAIMLFDSDKEVVMPVTFEQIAILLNFQDKGIKKLKKENKELQQEIDDTWKKYEAAHGISIRNTDWY